VTKEEEAREGEEVKVPEIKVLELGNAVKLTPISSAFADTTN